MKMPAKIHSLIDYGIFIYLEGIVSHTGLKVFFGLGTSLMRVWASAITATGIF